MGPPQGWLGGSPGGSADPGARPLREMEGLPGGVSKSRARSLPLLLHLAGCLPSRPAPPNLVLLEALQDRGGDRREPPGLALQGSQQGECRAQRAQQPHPRHSARRRLTSPLYGPPSPQSLPWGVAAPPSCSGLAEGTLTAGAGWGGCYKAGPSQTLPTKEGATGSPPGVGGQGMGGGVPTGFLAFAFRSPRPPLCTPTAPFQVSTRPAAPALPQSHGAGSQCSRCRNIGRGPGHRAHAAPHGPKPQVRVRRGGGPAVMGCR